MPDRMRLKAAEAWEEERQMNELNASLERQSERERIAVEIARENYSDNDCEVDERDHEKLFVEPVDGGYWVKARVWVDADDVEERFDPGFAADKKFLRKHGGD